jgi:hypothetical protein
LAPVRQTYDQIEAACICDFSGRLPALNKRADVLIDIERVSDTQAIVTGTGSINIGTTQTFNPHVLILSDPFGLEPPALSNAYVLSASTLSMGSVPFNFALACGTGPSCAPNTSILIGNLDFVALTPGDTFSGSLSLLLTAGTTLAAEGSTGVVYWGSVSGEVPVGTWEMTGVAAVPLHPLPLLGQMLLMGLVGFGFLAYRRKGKMI